MSAIGECVTSKRLLRRLELKGIIREPQGADRPTLPSQQEWGSARGYCYVDVPDSTPPSFAFEGSQFTVVHKEQKTYLYKKYIGKQPNKQDA